MGDIPGQSLHGGQLDARGRPGAAPTPWRLHPRAPVPEGLAQGLSATAEGIGLPIGIERRLPHRAEQLWLRLKGEAELPPAGAASALLAPPFTTQALLVTRPDRARPQIAFAGTDLGELGAPRLGPARADPRPTAPIPDRLVALAMAATAHRRPRHLDSDFDPDLRGPNPGVLFRAVALPLEPERGSGLAGLAVAILSWRKLLSRDETDALHSELQAAIGWMGSAGYHAGAR